MIDITKAVEEVFKDLERTIEGSLKVIKAIDNKEEINQTKAVKAICKSQRALALSVYTLLLTFHADDMDKETVKKHIDKLTTFIDR